MRLNNVSSVVSLSENMHNGIIDVVNNLKCKSLKLGISDYNDYSACSI